MRRSTTGCRPTCAAAGATTGSAARSCALPESAAAMADAGLSRREFLQASGGAGIGLMVAFCLPVPTRAAATPAGGELNAYVRIAPDGTVSLSIAKSEMGQGVLTSLALLLAEELEVDWTRVRSEHALADDKLYGRWMTGGSSSVRTGF